MKPSPELGATQIRDGIAAHQPIDTRGHDREQGSESLKIIEPRPPVRMLKIEAEGDLWKGLLKPKIRLMGRWLERAGFKPGQRVHVRCLAPGVIELRSPHLGGEREQATLPR